MPHVDLGVRETPVERRLGLLIKRDDLSTSTLGGNKVRALQFLLAGVQPGETVLTVGSTGSTHALAVAHFARRLGALADVITWPQESHHVAEATAARTATLARVTAAHSTTDAYVRAAWRRATTGTTWIPAGGSSPLGALGHVDAALELVAQLQRESMRLPDTIVVPVGTGGTIAGLLVGLAIAGVSPRVLGVRVVPNIVANRWRVLRLARRTRALFTTTTGIAIPEIDGSALQMDPDGYGGAYARVTSAGRQATILLGDAGGPRLDDTYSAKAFARALVHAAAKPDEQHLFWLTFDGRWLDDGPGKVR